MKQIYIYILTMATVFYGCIHCATRLPLNTKRKPFKQDRLDKSMPHKKGDPLRVLFVVDGFPHFDQPFILDQIVGLIERGHDVYIAAMSEVKNTIVPNAVYKYDLMDRTVFFGKSNPFQFFQSYVQMPHINTFDVICSQFGNVGADVIRFKRSMKGIYPKLVTCWRGSTKEVTMQPYQYAALFEQGDLFLPVCEFLKNDLMELGCDPNKIRVLYVGINYEHYSCNRVVYDNNSVNIMSICRLVEKKGIEYAIKAVASLTHVYPNIHYTIVGDGPLKKELKSLVKQLNMQEHIVFIGNHSHEKIPAILRDADIFLSPSVTTPEGNQEGIANSLKEAMASGVLVIGTDHAGTSELINEGVSGFLVPERDVEALAETIHYLVLHPEIWDAVRFHARQVVKERFDLSASVDQFIAILEEVCIH